MGRFSPTVLPTAQPSFTQMLEKGFDQFLQARAARNAQQTAQRSADDAHVSQQAKYVDEGGRFGAAPVETGVDISVPANAFERFTPRDDVFSAPSSSDLARGLRGEAAPLRAGQGDFTPPSGSEWSTALRGTPNATAPTGTDFDPSFRIRTPELTPPASTGTQPTAAAPLMPSRSGALHPGAFDPETHTFGGTPQRAAADAARAAAATAAQAPATVTHLAAPGRYVQVDPGHYTDLTMTPAGQRMADREAQRELSAALLGQRLDTQRTIAGDKINATATNLETKGTQAAAHDDRTTDRQLGVVDADTGVRAGGTIAARGDQAVRAVDERAAKRAPPLTRYVHEQGADGRLWLRSVNDPSDVRPLNGPDGRQITGHLPSAGGGGSGGGMGSGGIGGIARQASAIVGMENAHENMLPFEESIRTGKANYTGLDYFKGRLAKMYDAKGIVNDAIHAATFADMDEKNPELANYLRAAEQWALEDGSLSGRSSDFRTKLDSFISAIGPRAAKSQIDQTQKFRGTRIEELKKFQPAMEAMGARAAGGAPKPAAAAPTPAAGKGGDVLSKYNITPSKPDDE